MKCYNCDHLITDPDADCLYCHFPVEDTKLLMRAAEDAKREMQLEYEVPQIEDDLIENHGWQENIFNAITNSTKVVQLNY
ncbi:MAG: hypothetical protein R3275_07785 [Saprospiraceae bacterium]|nr:hypothetical protein [Saprospiraceae bacterium]